MRKHGVRFENSESSWANGLPLGNGVFGTLMYFNHNKLFMPLNHYEIYYNHSKAVLPIDQEKDFVMSDNPGEALREQCERARKNIPQDGEPFTWYGNDRLKKGTTTPMFSGSYPQTGDVVFNLDESLSCGESLLKLDVEDARVTLNRKNKKDEVSIQTIFAREDCAVSRISQTESGFVKNITLSLKPVRDAIFPRVTYKQVSDNQFVWSVEVDIAGKAKPFRYAGALTLVGAVGSAVQGENCCEITVSGEKSFTAIVAVCTDWRYENPVEDIVSLSEEYANKLDYLYDEHKRYWEDFFSHCGITLPDLFLERVWYINQYALDCSSGRDGVMKHHACGLNGLWDVKRPTLWGSMWYWDVNIQAAFAGVFSSNHIHLGKVFSDGLNTYKELARMYAKSNHNKTGIAFDYPYFCYFSVWPWCALYLWQYYEYTQDIDYLKDEAYPLFTELCEFALQLFEYDEARDCYCVFPDISPEQGPLSHNTTITVAATRKLLSFTLEAAGILKDESETVSKIRTLYEHLPEYALTEREGEYGIRFKDSEEAPDNLWIRHPGMMMPVFPAGEIGLRTEASEKMMNIAKNTLSYLEDRCETGIFGGSWLAAAAARLGEGQKAIRLLYQKGLDHMLRSNGLSAEETDRFINLCLTMRQPIYYPCMMEYTGEMLAAVNEMLMQSFGDAINVFPALPNGDKEYYRTERFGFSMEDHTLMFGTYPAWRDVRFDTLRARGAFLVSSLLKANSLQYIKLESLAGKHARVTSPYISNDFIVYSEGTKIPFAWENNAICFDTEKNKTYLIAKNADAYIPDKAEETNEKVDFYEAHITKRRVYLGENGDTAYNLVLDNFSRDSMFGDLLCPQRSVYRFDFGSAEKTEKMYNDDRAPQTYWTNLERTTFAMAYYRMISPESRRKNGYTHFSELYGLPWNPNPRSFDVLYSVQQGFGFKHIDDVEFADSLKPDSLRRDFAQGKEDNEFIIDVTKGQYDILVCSGDANEDSVTTLSVNGSRVYKGEVLTAGKWQMRTLTLFTEEDEPIRLSISTDKGYKWKLNFILINQIKRIY